MNQAIGIVPLTLLVSILGHTSDFSGCGSDSITMREDLKAMVVNAEDGSILSWSRRRNCGRSASRYLYGRFCPKRTYVVSDLKDLLLIDSGLACVVRKATRGGGYWWILVRQLFSALAEEWTMLGEGLPPSGGCNC